MTGFLAQPQCCQRAVGRFLLVKRCSVAFLRRLRDFVTRRVTKTKKLRVLLLRQWKPPPKGSARPGGWSVFLKKKLLRNKKRGRKFVHVLRTPYLCSRKYGRVSRITKSLGYGVMVTLQILVLSFLVRVRVPQHNRRRLVLTKRFLFIRRSG